MDLNKIFIKDACPTKIGGQAVLEGVMMRNQRQIAISVRKADGSIQTKKYVTKPKGAWAKWPFIRGVFAFVDSLIIGTGTLMYSAEVLEDDAGEVEEKGKLETWIENKFGGKAAYNFMIWTSVLISLVFTIGVFIILPTVAVNWTKKVTENAIILNLIEGVLRIAIFILYVAVISKMQDIKRVFQYHGAEHKSIACYESGDELTPANAKKHTRFHPRCGTSFLFVMLALGIVIGVLLRVFLPQRIIDNHLLYTGIRLLVLPLVVGIGFEYIMFAGKHDNVLTRILSAPGLWFQRITTREPDESQLEVAITALKYAHVAAFPDFDRDAVTYCPKEKGEEAPEEGADAQPADEPAENGEGTEPDAPEGGKPTTDDAL